MIRIGRVQRGTSHAGLFFLVLALVQPALAEGGRAARPAAEVRVPNFLGVTGKALALKLHLGYGGGIYGRELLAGTELFVADNVSAMAEYAHGDVNVGGRFHARHFSATVGLFDFRHVGGGIGYTVALR